MFAVSPTDCSRPFHAQYGSVRRQTLIFTLGWTLTSCAFRQPSHDPTVKPPPSPVTAAAPTASIPPARPAAAHRVGTVRVIGDAQRFVLIEVSANGVPALPDGQLLRCAADPSSDSPSTATLRVARERRRPFIVADVVTGEPHVGDPVFAAPASSLAATYAPIILPTRTSDVLPIGLPAAMPNP